MENEKLSGLRGVPIYLADADHITKDGQVIESRFGPIGKTAVLPSENSSVEQRNTTSLPIRSFSTGATRDTDSGKLAYEGFFSPAVLRRRAQYMHKHRKMADGSMREPDNWQKGIPMNVYLDSLIRHTVELWLAKRGEIEMDTDAMEEYMQDTLCAIMFNAEGLLMERMKLQKGAAEPGE